MENVEDMEFEEFCELVNPPKPTPDKASPEFDAFLFFCFTELFKSDPPHPADAFLATAAAHSFSQNDYVRGTQISHRSVAIRYPQKSFKPSRIKGLRMR